MQASPHTPITPAPNRYNPPMDWLNLSVTVPGERVEETESLLLDYGAAAVTLLDAGDHPLHEPGPGETPMWPESVVRALFEPGVDRAGVIAALSGAGLIESPAALYFDTLVEREWERVWMDRFEPMRFGENLWICPWHVAPGPDWAVVVRLDPGLAFGTGTHETTALCLEWIDGRNLGDTTVIDYGAGSGVLAIACALKGAARVIAVDHDAQALDACRENARRNGVLANIEVCSPETLPEVSADVVLANILAGPLVALAERIGELVTPGGALVLSGVLAEQGEAVAAAYRSRFPDIAEHRRGDWLRLDGTRPA